MIIKEKRYIKKCDCGTEIIYTRRDCYHNTTWDIYSLYCPSCSHEYSYRRGTYHDLFDKEYEEDSVDKDEEIERLNNIIDKKEQFLGDNIKRLEREVVKRDNVINGMEKFFQYAYDNEVREINDRKVSVWTICLDKLQELKGSDKE